VLTLDRTRCNCVIVPVRFRGLRVLLSRDVELVISRRDQVIVIRSDANVWTSETQIDPLGLPCRQSVWVQIVPAPLITHPQTWEVGVWTQRNKRAFHLATVTNTDCKVVQPTSVKENWHYRV